MAMIPFRQCSLLKSKNSSRIHERENLAHCKVYAIPKSKCDETPKAKDATTPTSRDDVALTMNNLSTLNSAEKHNLDENVDSLKREIAQLKEQFEIYQELIKLIPNRFE